MKTNNKAVKAQLKAHILESVLNEYGKYFSTFSDAQNHVKQEFNRVANYTYNLHKLPNNQDRFSDYLCGLPFNFHYYFDDIKNYLNSLGINPERKEFSDDKSLKLYHLLIYKEIF